MKKSQVIKTQRSRFFSIFFLLDKDIESIQFLSESLKKISEENMQELDLNLVLKNDSVELRYALSSNLYLAGLIERKKISIIDYGQIEETVSFRSSKVSTLQHYVLLFTLDGLCKIININQLFSFKDEKYSPDSLTYIHFQQEDGAKQNIRITDKLFLLPADVLKYVCSNRILESEELNRELLHRIKKLGLPTADIELNQSFPFRKDEPGQGFFRNIGTRLKLNYNWYLRLPVKEIRTKPHLQYSFIRENPAFRLAFLSLITVLFVLMPLLSLNAGLSGDEPNFQYPHALKVYNYYASLGKDTTYKNSGYDLNSYGMSFDILTVFVIKLFKITNIYEARHFMNGMAGWTIILFTGLLAVSFAGWRAGLIALLLVFFSPSFIGHAWNNPKDIPFAAGYIMGVFFIIRFLREFPKPSKSTIVFSILSIAAAISVRVGGLILIAYLFLFAGFYILFTGSILKFLSKANLLRIRNMIGYLLFISLAGYFIGLLLWPYGIENPIKNPITAFTTFANYTTSLRQVFEGKFIWSDRLPWNYLPEYIMLTAPIIVFGGALFYFAFFARQDTKPKYFWPLLLVFTFAFPIGYIIYKGSNVYGGWRHALFAYPPLVTMAAIGYDRLLSAFRKIYFRYGITAIMAIMLYHPVRYIIVNHPYEYTYFNEIAGGVDNAFGKYEIDYYYHSVREASLWLKDMIKKDPGLKNRKLIVAANYSPTVDYYFKDMRDNIKVIYLRYYDRGEYDWDYAIIADSYINPYQLRKRIWPPKNTIHTLMVDDVPICAIIERKNKDDYSGTQYLNQKNYDLAVPALKQAIAYDPNNETALLNLAKAYLESGKNDSCLEIINRCLKVYPDYDKALNFMGIAYLNKNDYSTAISVFQRIIKVNPKYVSAYFNLGYIYKNLNNPQLAINYLQQAIMVNKNFKNSYYLLAEILKSLGKNAEAQQVLQLAANP